MNPLTSHLLFLQRDRKDSLETEMSQLPQGHINENAVTGIG